MKRIILLLMCVICTSLTAQNLVGEIYPDKAISMNHQMSFLGISFSKSLSSFENSLKQKGYRHVGEDYYDEHHYKGFLYGNKEVPLSIVFDDDHNIKMLYSENKFHNKAIALSYYNKMKQGITSNYSHTLKTTRNVFDKYNDTENHIYWDVFSTDNQFHIGHIELFMATHNDLSEYDVTFRYIDIPSNYSEYVLKKYDITDYIRPTYAMGYVEIYPCYSNLTLYNSDGSVEKYCIDLEHNIEKFILNNKYNNDEKKYILNQYMAKIRSEKRSKANYLFDITASIYFDNYTHDYERAKEEYNNHPHQMSKGELWFCLWEGSERIAKYKADGSYQRRMQMFINTWNSIAGSGGGSTNWDGLNDAQKAAIHEHDNAR